MRVVKAGDIVKSKAGHDEGRIYLVLSRINEDFILVCDGKYRPALNPKTKRNKHVSKIGESEKLSALLLSGKLTDADLICELKQLK